MLPISDVRLAEHLATFATQFPEGATCEEYRAAAFPRSKSTRGARRLLHELVRRGLVTTRGERYLLGEPGWALYRNPHGEPDVTDGLEGDEGEPDDDWSSLPEIHRQAVELGCCPAPPLGPWIQDSAGVHCVARDGTRWSSPGPPELPRATKGPFVFVFDGHRALAERRVGVELYAERVQPEQTAGSNVNPAPQPQRPEPAWPGPRLGTDLRWYYFDGSAGYVWTGVAWRLTQ